MMLWNLILYICYGINTKNNGFPTCLKLIVRCKVLYLCTCTCVYQGFFFKGEWWTIIQAWLWQTYNVDVNIVIKQIATLVKCLKIKMSRVVNSQMICKTAKWKFTNLLLTFIHVNYSLTEWLGSTGCRSSASGCSYASLVLRLWKDLHCCKTHRKHV